MAKCQSRGPAQKHMRYHAFGKHRAENTITKLTRLAQNNPGMLINAIASLRSDPENGITSDEAYVLIKKFLIGSQGGQSEPQFPESEGPDCTELAGVNT